MKELRPWEVVRVGLDQGNPEGVMLITGDPWAMKDWILPADMEDTARQIARAVNELRTREERTNWSTDPDIREMVREHVEHEEKIVKIEDLKGKYSIALAGNEAIEASLVMQVDIDDCGGWRVTFRVETPTVLISTPQLSTAVRRYNEVNA